jgi:hypothetical protein
LEQKFEPNKRSKKNEDNSSSGLSDTEMTSTIPSEDVRKAISDTFSLTNPSLPYLVPVYEIVHRFAPEPSNPVLSSSIGNPRPSRVQMALIESNPLVSQLYD